MVIKIGIIGAGVSGLACAVQIIKFVDPSLATVSIYSDDFTPNTTGNGSAGLWGPYLCGSTSQDAMMKWGQISHDYFLKLWKNGFAADAGISLMPILRLSDAHSVFDAFWKDIVFGFSNLTQMEIDQINRDQSKQFRSGVRFLSFTCEPNRWLPYLMNEFKAAGGIIEQRHIFKLDDLADESDIIVNCTGLGAKSMIADETVYSIRGQVMYADAPWQLFAVLDDSDIGNYIIPNSDFVVLGGTHQYGDYNRNIDYNDTKFIRNGCIDMIKPLQNVRILKEWVGLRPGRDCIRLEKDSFISKSDKLVNVIHNYGHGGCGVTFAWGCATDVVQFIENILMENIDIMKSKL